MTTDIKPVKNKPLHLCRHPDCYENANLFNYLDRGLMYCLPSCEKHKQWATDYLEEHVEND